MHEESVIQWWTLQHSTEDCVWIMSKSLMPYTNPDSVQENSCLSGISCWRSSNRFQFFRKRKTIHCRCSEWLRAMIVTQHWKLTFDVTILVLKLRGDHHEGGIDNTLKLPSQHLVHVHVLCKSLLAPVPTCLCSFLSVKLFSISVLM